MARRAVELKDFGSMPPPATERRGPPRRARAPLADLLLALYPLGLVGLTLLALAAPQRAGAAALAQVFAHFLFVPALLLVPFALRHGMFLLRLALAAAAAAFLLAYPPALNLAAPPAAAPGLTLLTWNVYVGAVAPEQLRAALAEHRPDVALLQEARWEDLAADAALAAAYPYQLVRPEETAPSLVVLSRYPIIASGVPALAGPQWDMPRVVWARLDIGGRAVTVVNAHPMPPRTFGAGCSTLRCYNTGPRDAQIAQLRAFVEELRHSYGDPLVLAGDMNVAEREQAYFDLAAGLHDAHRTVGVGFGTSWRPAHLPLSVGLIRIDYVLTAGPARPLSLQTDCTPRGSDHCLLVAGLALQGGEGQAAGRGVAPGSVGGFGG